MVWFLLITAVIRFTIGGRAALAVLAMPIGLLIGVYNEAPPLVTLGLVMAPFMYLMYRVDMADKEPETEPEANRENETIKDEQGNLYERYRFVNK